jgi:hypothetical protein
MTLYKLILKLSCDTERPASFNFALQKRKKSAVAIFGEKGGFQITLFIITAI